MLGAEFNQVCHDVSHAGYLVLLLVAFSNSRIVTIGHVCFDNLKFSIIMNLRGQRTDYILCCLRSYANDCL